MSRELMKMVGVSVCSSLCTAVFVVACTASADKMDDDERGSGDELAEDDGEDGGDEGGPGDRDDDDNSSGDDDGGLADLVTQVGEMATQIDELTTAVADLKANTFRWETYEVECPEGSDDTIYTEVGSDAVFAMVAWRQGDETVWTRDSLRINNADSGDKVYAPCQEEYDGEQYIYRVAYHW